MTRPETDPPDHPTVEELLGAYADGELDDESVGRVEAHLARCDPCRKELTLQTALRTHLAAGAPSTAPADLRARISRSTYAAPGHKVDEDASRPKTAPFGAEPERQPRRAWRRAVPWAGWVVAAVLAALLLVQPDVRPGPAPGMPTATVSGTDVPMVDDALDDYRRLVGGDLPIARGGIAQVERRTPFPVTPLESPDARLIGAWTTEILGEPAAALAYRWGDRIVVQYVVSEALFFAPPEVRRAVALEGRYLTSVGEQGVLAWPGTASGSILVGDAPPAELARLRS